jgi:tetratricopeptide (TPR) repeat protein
MELATALADIGRRDEAVAEYREAIRLNKDFAVHFVLGGLLYDQVKLPGAEAEYREAIRIKADYALAHHMLGVVLHRQGHYAESLAAYQRGQASAQLVREAEALAELDAKLPQFLKGQAKPADAAEYLQLAEVCQEHKHLNVAAARFYEEAFASQPELLEKPWLRYNAACAAALAGGGRGDDAPGNQGDCARLRSQALDWLRADLNVWKPQLSSADPAVRQQAGKGLAHWRDDDDLAVVRSADALAKLPEGERADWRQLWADLDALLPKVKP